jgi:tryptophan-rich hypothetical protein
MTAPTHPTAPRLNPRKLLLSKWTAVTPQQREKHFMVVKLIEPAEPGATVQEVELEAVLSRRSQTLAWRELTDTRQWRQGWL